MVRVNTGVQPSALTDEHLRAENVELMMLAKFIEKHPNGTIPGVFSLNRGHMSFFRDKATFVFVRLYAVQEEMKIRNMSINVDANDFFDGLLIPQENFGTYTPTPQDIKIILNRIEERLMRPLKKKTKWHYYGLPIANETAIKILTSLA